MVGGGGVLIVEELVAEGNNEGGERRGNTMIMITKPERPKGQRYALAIEDGEDVFKVAEGDRE